MFAWFITHHGYGHAARSASVIQALLSRRPGARFRLYTRVPSAFFRQGLPAASVQVCDCVTDVGLVQPTPIREDLPATVERLDRFLPFDPEIVNRLAAELTAHQCRVVVADIAPLGIAVGKAAGLPTVLIENFTWDWIYREYVRDHPSLAPHITYLREVTAAADHHIQTEPFCAVREGALSVPPVCRPPRTPRDSIRQELRIPDDANLVMIAMGGVPDRYPFVDALAEHERCHFVAPCAIDSISCRGNVTLLPHHSRFYHPDLVHAADAIVAKAGYSTLAEVYHAGLPFGYILRDTFPETPPFEHYLRRHFDGIRIRPEEFYGGRWIRRIPELLSLPRANRGIDNGADHVAEYLLTVHARRPRRAVGRG